MRRQQIVLAGLALFGSLTTAAFGTLLAIKPAWLGWSEERPAPATTAKPAEAHEQPRIVPAAKGPLVDFMRIAPGGGVSVLAGRGTAKTYVTVYENGRPVGTAKVDENGEWSMVTEHAFMSAEPALTIRDDVAGPVATSAPSVTTFTEIRQSKPDAPQSAATAVEQKVLRDLQTAVAAAKVPSSQQSDDQTTRVPARVASADRSGVHLPSGAPGPRDSEPLISVPVPITFVYREAKPTPTGEQAARPLVEYVKLKGIRALELTGHADERGSDEFNMQLSQQRLEIVAQLLRRGGYDGELALLPRGRTEPYRGVDRSTLAREDIYQLDRRVELRAAR